MFALQVSQDIFSFIALLGIMQGLMLAALVYFHPRSDRPVNKFLSLYLLCLTVIMSGPLILKAITWQKSFFLTPFSLLAGPLLYLYIRSFMETVTWKKALPHLVLFFLFFFPSYWWVEYLARLSQGARDLPPLAFDSPMAYAMIFIRYAQLTLYYFLSMRSLRHYQRSIRHMYSDTDQVDMHWAKWLINGYLFIILFSFACFFLMLTYTNRFYLIYLVNIAVATPYIYISSYKGIMQPTIWQKAGEEGREELENELRVAEAMEDSLQEKQTVASNEVRNTEILSLLQKALVDEKLYQETDLTLQQLSQRLGYPPHRVSQAINNGMNKNFYELINGYRVEEAKRMLTNPATRQYTILSIGFEAGFNSKTTFNTVFKKFTGCTPSEFREQQNTPALTARNPVSIPFRGTDL